MDATLKLIVSLGKKQTRGVVRFRVYKCAFLQINHKCKTFCVCVSVSACEHRSTVRDSFLLAVVSLCAPASSLHLSSRLQRNSKPVE